MLNQCNPMLLVLYHMMTVCVLICVSCNHGARLDPKVTITVVNG